MSTLHYDLVVFKAYSPDYSCNNNVVVIDITRHSDKSSGTRVSSGICPSLLSIESSDWNLFYSLCNIKLDSIKNILKSIFCDKSYDAYFILLLVEDQGLASVASNSCRSNDFQRCILVYCFENSNEYAQSLDACSASNLSRLFYYKKTTEKEKTYIVDSLAYAFLRYSLVCVDITDLFSVLRGNLCCATFLCSSYSKSNFVLKDFLENNKFLLEKSSGVFMCFMYNKFINFSIDDIDILAKDVSSKLNKDTSFLFSVDYQRELDFEFGCVLFVVVH